MANQNCEEFECRIPKDNCNELYSVQTFWFEDKMVVNVWDHTSVWSGEVTADALLGFSTALDIDFKAYYSECKRVLTKNGGDTQFVYGIENSHFVWKKVDPDNNVKVKFGSVLVESVTFTDKGIAILDGSFNCVLRLSAALRAEEERKLKCDEEMKMLKQKLTKLCQEKEKLENELYVKFLSLLNQKKEKIRSLEEKCERSVSPKKRSNFICSDTDSDLDDPATCSASTATSPTWRGETTPTKTKKQKKHKLEMEAAPLELKPGVHQRGAGDGEDHRNHYDSDTDVDASTDEEKPTFEYVSSEPNPTAMTMDVHSDLFSEVGSPPVTLPKRVTKSALRDTAEAGPSFRKTEVKKLSTAVELPKTLQSHDFNTQDLFEDLGRDD